MKAETVHRRVIAEWDPADEVWLVLFADGTVEFFQTPEEVLDEVRERDADDSASMGVNIVTELTWQDLPPGFVPPKHAKISTRNIPAGDRISGIRGLEDAFADDAWDTYQARIEEAMLGDPHGLHAAFDDALASLESELTALAPTYLFDAYALGSEDVYADFQLTAADEELLSLLMEDETGILPAIGGFLVDLRMGMDRALDEAWMRGFFNEDILRERLDEADDAAWEKFQFIARTEVTKAANWGKSTALESVGESRVWWITALDDRVCVRCMALEEAGPWGLDELTRETDGTLSGHPGCRCVVGGRTA